MDAKTAQQLAEQVRRTLEHAPWRDAAGTASLNVATAAADEDSSPNQMLMCAVVAKRGGRDRVRRFDGWS
jgi:GGDEF domain-containing protein